MKKIRMKKAARDELPHLESDGNIKLSDKKMANRPERECSHEPRTGDGLQGKNSDVHADTDSNGNGYGYTNLDAYGYS